MAWAVSSGYETQNDVKDNPSSLPVENVSQPSWMTEDTDETQGIAPREISRIAPPSAPKVPRQQVNTPHIFSIMRIVNVGISVLLGATAILEFIPPPENFQVGVLAVYLLFFALAIFSFEVHLRMIARKMALNFGFMYRPLGRPFFFLLVGILCYSFDSVLGYISGSVTIANAFFNLFVLCKHPSARESLYNKDLQSPS